jgi:predicted O-methyltransferase YrrM
MRIRKPDWPELEYAQQMMAWMLFIEQPRAIAQLGLGAATLTKFCYRQFPQAQVTAVELNPSVIAICESMFKLPPDDERLQVLEMDAMDFVDDPPTTAPSTCCSATCTTPPRAARCSTRPSSTRPATPAWPRTAS